MKSLVSLSAPFLLSSFSPKSSNSRHLSLPPFHHTIATSPLFPSPRPRSKSSTTHLLCAPFPAAVTAAQPDVETGAAEGKEQFDWYAQWYPLAPVCDLDKRAPHGKRVMGLDVVVWWDQEENQWRVFEDLCPHRLAPLSEGRIDRWGRLQCVYHGWCFSGEGRCQLIPQAPPDGPPVHTFNKACVAVYPSMEQNKIVWFWPSTDPQYEDIQMKKRPPYIPELDDPSYTSTMGMRDIPYGYEVLVENLMDPSHVRYAHRGIMRVPKRKASLSRYDREGGTPLEISIETLNISGFVAKLELGYGMFVPPCLFYSFFNSGKIGKDSDASDDQKRGRVLLVFICIPVSPGRSRLIWVFPRNFAVWADKIIPRWIFHVGQNLILDSDLYLLHLEERKIAEVGPSNWQKACFVPTKSDAMVIAFRKWLKKYSNNQVDWGSKFSGFLPPTPPKEELMDRYWSHTLQCSSCRVAEKGLKALEVVLQIMSVAAIGIVAAAKERTMSAIIRSVIVSAAILCFLASRWLSHFIYKNFYFHDYNHAFK